MDNPIYEFAKQIISGVGGLEDLYTYEMAVDNFPHDEVVAIWVIKCLANPKCAGSREILDLIEARRLAQQED